jgi:uncharacterized protein (TIGR03435 family)
MKEFLYLTEFDAGNPVADRFSGMLAGLTPTPADEILGNLGDADVVSARGGVLVHFTVLRKEQPKESLTKMQHMWKRVALCQALMAIAAFAQPKPTFEVATIKPSAPLDPAKMIAAMQSGGKMPIGANIDSRRAEYTYLDLKSLMTYAYGVKPYQISGPDWMSTTRFDIIAKMPEGATKDDAPKMLQALLEDRFKLEVHRTSAEHPVMALVVGKGGPKLKASEETPVAIDESAPLKPGEVKMDGAEGPVRMKIDVTTGSSVVDMGLRGKVTQKLNPATQSLHIEFKMTTMSGFADIVAQLFTQLGGGATGGRQVVDMTGIKGNYDASIDLSLMEIIAMARAMGANIPTGPLGGAAGPGNAVASDPGGGGASLTDALNSMGLKLESRKAVVDQLIVDHIEKAPTEN